MNVDEAKNWLAIMEFWIKILNLQKKQETAESQKNYSKDKLYVYCNDFIPILKEKILESANQAKMDQNMTRVQNELILQWDAMLSKFGH